jgi:fatty-acid desaturase
MFKSDLKALTLIQFLIFPALAYFLPRAAIADFAIVAAFTWLYSCIGHHVILHRYFTHQQFSLPAWRERLFLFISIFAGIGGPVSYVATHLVHHRFADTEKDVHGPKLGLASMIYALRPTPRNIRSRRLLDLHKQYGFIDQYYLLIIACAVVGVGFYSPWIALTTLIIPMSLSNNIAAIEVYTQHWGGRRANNFGYFFTFGAFEGLHRNHHDSPGKTNCARDRLQFDWIFLFCRIIKEKNISYKSN